MNLGDYSGSGSHSIPYALTPAEIQIFLERHAGDLALQRYMSTGEPPYGIIVQEGATPAEFLVWLDASHAIGDIDGLHVIDVTFMPIAAAVKQLPYESPSGSVIAETIAEIESLLSSLAPTINLGLLLAIVIGGFFLVREIKR